MTDYLTPNNDIITQQPIPPELPYYNTLPNQENKNSYKTHFNCIDFLIFFGLIIIGGAITCLLFYLYIKENEKQLIYPILVLSFIIIGGSCISGFSPLYASFIVNPYLGVISVKTVKLFFCFNKSKIIQINNIQSVLIECDTTSSYNINDKHINTLKVIFILHDGNKVDGCSRVVDRNHESLNIYNFIKGALPPNIPVEGNLLSQYFK